MNGINYFLDTNAIIGFFNKNENLRQYVLLQNKIIISIISVLEFPSFKTLTWEEKDLFPEFCDESDIVDIKFENTDLVSHVPLIRTTCKLKLPNAIIAASAQIKNAILVINDKQFFVVPNLQILNF